MVNTHVVICGAGVIGAATAYFLSLRGIQVSVIERCEVACAASGKAGGFLALDWCDGSPLQNLARQSFALHKQLASDLAQDYGYRALTTIAVNASAQPLTAADKQPHPEFNWLDRNGSVYSILGTPKTTAQVHPHKFTQALMQQAQAHGAKLINGCVDGVILSAGQIGGVRVDGQMVAADHVVIAMGPWSTAASEWLPIPPVMGLKGHSIILRPTRSVPAQALFVDYLSDHGERLTPEVYPRTDGAVYLSGLSDQSALPEDPAQVKARTDAGPVLQKIAADLSSRLAGLQPQKIQACYRPVYADGLPLLGKIPNIKGAYIATGHSCWGILNAPASGLALAELITSGAADCVDLTPFDPARAYLPGASRRFF